MAAKLNKNATSKRWRNVVLLQRTMHIIFCTMSEHLQLLSARFVDVSCPKNPRELFCGFSLLAKHSPTRCVDAKSFAQRFSYANLNIDQEMFISWFVVFCLKILLCAAASSAGEFRVRFNVNFKLFLYFNSDLLPSTRSFSSPFSLHSFVWFVPQKCRIQIGIDRLYRCKAFGGWLSSWTSCS